ncbi:S8 family serine peptidase [uncultured Anaerococcus sp.]|uniref:S8 family serine peptidase n=1 Tax=uncultured Anaerococcus sp. TaxID=293428 RepID=UPI0025FCC2A4|nr:S8 family serine peptidase [uncultured Anaerococcus sp.]
MTFKINYKSNSAKIAVLDSGYEQNNDENIKIVKIFDYDDGIDRYGHGKKVIDIINKSNKSAQIYSIKVLDDVGKGNRKRILKALDWCYYNNIELINISFSMSIDDKLIKDKIDQLSELGVVVICSYDNTNILSYPASYISTIGVTAHDKYFRKDDVFIYKDRMVAYGKDLENSPGYYNSYATARVTAFLSYNMDKIDEIRSKLNE